MINKYGSLEIKPEEFMINLSRMLHIEKQYAIIVMKELMDMGLIKEYSAQKIVFKKTDELKVFLED